MVGKKLTLNLAQSKHIPAGTIVTVGNFTTAKFTAPYYSCMENTNDRVN